MKTTAAKTLTFRRFFDSKDVAQHQQLTNTAGAVNIVTTEREDGDFQIKNPARDVEDRRAAIVGHRWTWLHQVHGSNVVEVDQPGYHAGASADAAITRTVGCPVAVTTADCAPVVLVSTTGVAVIHAGWRGTLAGVIGHGAERLLADGSRPLTAVVGPTIGADVYEFDEVDLAPLVAKFGPDVKANTANGRPALDMAQIIKVACEKVGFGRPQPAACTSNERWFSHRCRREAERFTTVAWIDPISPK